MVVRAESEPLAIVPAIRSLIEEMDPDLPISEIRPMEHLVADSMSRTTFTMTLLVLAALVALLLGFLGVYGVSRTCRAREPPRSA